MAAYGALKIVRRFFERSHVVDTDVTAAQDLPRPVRIAHTPWMLPHWCMHPISKQARHAAAGVHDPLADVLDGGILVLPELFV